MTTRRLHQQMQQQGQQHIIAGDDEEEMLDDEYEHGAGVEVVEEHGVVETMEIDDMDAIINVDDDGMSTTADSSAANNANGTDGMAT